MWQIATGVLAVLLVISILTSGFKTNSNPSDSTTVEGLVVIELNDKRCAECDTSALMDQLKQILPDLEVQSIDYNSEQGKKLHRCR